MNSCGCVVCLADHETFEKTRHVVFYFSWDTRSNMEAILFEN